MRLTPISWTSLAEALADRVTAIPPAPERPWHRLAVDAAPAARPQDLADALAQALRLRGRPAQRVRASDFWRSASLRLEYGRNDPDAYYDRWLDTGALRREVLDPLGPDGNGRILPSLWDAAADRATRAPYVQLPPGGVVVLDGALLLGQGLDLDLTVHLRLSPAALARRTPDGERSTLPAFARYDDEALPGRAADVLVHADDPRRPAWAG